jgi:hypothetical protein
VKSLRGRLPLGWRMRRIRREERQRRGRGEGEEKGWGAGAGMHGRREMEREGMMQGQEETFDTPRSPRSSNHSSCRPFANGDANPATRRPLVSRRRRHILPDATPGTIGS